MLMWLLIAGSTSVAPVPANAGPCHPAELFATDSSDQGGLDELELFALQATATLALNGAPVTGSALLDGVFWSDERQQVAVERARQFHLCVVDEPALDAAAQALRRQFGQQAVLTFDYLTEDARDSQAAIIAVPGIDFARFRDAFVADEAAHHRLLGGSVTATEPTLILVAANEDLDIAHRLVDASGGDWATATITYGDREIVR